MKTFNIICAADEKFGIGIKNDTKNKGIPWDLPTDMKYFRKITGYSESVTGINVVIMGRTTADLIGKPLPNRYNIRLSRKLESIKSSEDFSKTNYDKEFINCSSLDSAMDLVNNVLTDVENVFIIGGGELYKEAIYSPILKYVYLTHIKHDYDCDIFFPNISDKQMSNNFTVLSRKLVYDNNIMCEFTKLERKPHEEYQYLNLLEKIISTGHRRQTRNAITYSLFGEKMEFDLSSFPLLTTKKVFMRGIFEELKFFLMGKTDSKILEEKGVNIWRDNTTRDFLDKVGLEHYKEGDMGSMYFYNVFHFGNKYEGCDKNYTGMGYNQWAYVMNLLKTDPYSRRNIFTTYNPSTAHEGVLYPCHGLLCQFYVEEGHRLTCSMTMRSNDFICGNPFNVASYSLMVYIMCELLNNDESYVGPKFVPGKFIIFMNDVHVYEDNLEQAKEQLQRNPFPFPKLYFKKKFTKIEELQWEDIEVVDYKCHDAIKVKMVA
jgi:dihydrofolate reductase/thymidylate synthase